MNLKHFGTTGTAGLAIAAAASAFTVPDACAQSSAPRVVTGGATKGSFKLPGSDTSITLGGYVKLDVIASDRSVGVASTADQQYEAGAVPVGPQAGRLNCLQAAAQYLF
jgi:hypothetical protein